MNDGIGWILGGARKRPAERPCDLDRVVRSKVFPGLSSDSRRVPAAAVVKTLAPDGRVCGWFLCMVDAALRSGVAGIEYNKGIRWMPWHQEAMKDVARCEKPWGAASRR